MTLRGRQRHAASPGAGSNTIRIVLRHVPTVTENDDEVILRMAGTAWDTGRPAADFELATTGES